MEWQLKSYAELNIIFLELTVGRVDFDICTKLLDLLGSNISYFYAPSFKFSEMQTQNNQHIKERQLSWFIA